MAGDVVQNSSKSLVRQTPPWAQMSSQDQYGITAPQIQTLTLHYIAPVPRQAGKGHIESIYYPVFTRRTCTQEQKMQQKSHNF